MSENSDYERGRADARLDVNDERHLENIKRFDAIEATLKQLVESISLARGGVRMLFAVGSAGAGIGALVSSVVHWVGGHIK
jgi:hypothetical protein